MPHFIPTRLLMGMTNPRWWMTEPTATLEKAFAHQHGSELYYQNQAYEARSKRGFFVRAGSTPTCASRVASGCGRWRVLHRARYRPAQDPAACHRLAERRAACHARLLASSGENALTLRSPEYSLAIVALDVAVEAIRSDAFEPAALDTRLCVALPLQLKGSLNPIHVVLIPPLHTIET
jgi:hypothetical protein